MLKSVKKIAYVAEWNVFEHTGVLKKIKSQVESWRSKVAEVRLFVVSPEEEGASAVIDGEYLHIIPYKRNGWIVAKCQKIAALSTLRASLEEFAPDVVYYRQSSWTPGLLRSLGNKAPLVVEVNTLDVTETQTLGFLRSLYNKKTRGFLINATDAFVCVGNEVGEHYRQYGKPVSVVANGFDVASVFPNPRVRSERPQMIFVGSAGQIWHGVDQILWLAENIPEWDFHVVGEWVSCRLDNVTSYGAVSWARLKEIYSRMDFGIASLSLHRIGINEISPLKTREYLAHGLPVIGGYHDPDLDDCPFYLRLPNDEGGVARSVSVIREFVDRWNGVEIDRELVIDRVDWAAKESRRLAFMNEVVRKLAVA